MLTRLSMCSVRRANQVSFIYIGPAKDPAWVILTMSEVLSPLFTFNFKSIPRPRVDIGPLTSWRCDKVFVLFTKIKYSSQFGVH